MKKLLFTISLLLVTIGISAQKMTIRTSNGQTVELNCEGMMPTEIVVKNDTVVFKISSAQTEQETTEATVSDSDSIETFIPEGDALTIDSIAVDTLNTDTVTGQKQSGLSVFAEALAEELSPQYAQFVKEHEGTKPASENELVKDIAKQVVGEDVVETVDFLGSLFGYLRFTRDSTFVPTYPQRKPKKSLRTYDIIELSGSFGKNIAEISSIDAETIESEDYGDDTENHDKYGGGVKYSRVYISGKEVDGQWKPNPLGFAWSWGGLISFSQEKDIGSYTNVMGKVGIQIGNDITFGVDALLGCGVTPYNTFLSNEMSYTLSNKSAFCFKYGVQIWGCLNFTKDTYTAVFGRYINSIKPSNGNYNLSKGWNVVYEDFDPSSWTVGLAVGYKFGAPDMLSQDKRLQVNLGSGYNLCGNEGALLSAEIERLTQVSKSTHLSYGLALEQTFKNRHNNDNCTSIMFSAGFNVRQPQNTWFWGAKILAGVGEYAVSNDAVALDTPIFEDASTKVCLRGALQLNAGLQLGKLWQVHTGCRAGYHIGSSYKFEDFDDETKSKNLRGFDLGLLIGLKYLF